MIDRLADVEDGLEGVALLVGGVVDELLVHGIGFDGRDGRAGGREDGLADARLERVGDRLRAFTYYEVAQNVGGGGAAPPGAALST